MAIEAGGKNGVIEADKVTLDYVKGRTKKAFEVVANDRDASYYSQKIYKVKDLEPVVAKPHSPDNRAAARDLKDVKLDRAYVGSCTGGKMTDFLAAASILKDHKVKIPTTIVPATTEVHAELQSRKIGNKTIEQIFIDAGCTVGPASCAACLGGPEDTLGRLNQAGVRCISTTNRNFPGRMGHKQAEVFLASPLTVAASAVKGCVTDPREFVA